MLTKIEILLPDSRDFNDLVGKMNSFDEFKVDNMQKLVFEPSNYEIISFKDYDNHPADLIIIEDDFKDYCSIIKSASKVESIKSIIVLTKDIVAENILETIDYIPKIITLDFQFTKGGHDATFKSAYDYLKNKFINTPVVGITGFEVTDTQTELTSLLRRNGDSVYQKLPEFWTILPNIIRDKVRIYELQNNIESIKKNKKCIFIGSSTKSLKIAESIFRNLDKGDNIFPETWTQDTFKPSEYPLDNLIRKVDEVKYAIFVFHPDDIIEIKGKGYKTVRDNVLFELGLFMGKLGRKNVFFALHKGVKNFRIPSDLLGLTYLTYDDDYNENPLRATGSLCIDFLSKVESN